MSKQSTVDPIEVAKFAQHASQWWDVNGPLKTLHDVNPTRLQFIQSLTSLAGKTVLDVGCGGGILSEAMARCGALVTGLDVEGDAIHAAQLHAEEHNIPVEYICQPIETCETKEFDVITCMEMLEHVPEPSLIIHHAARLLKPDGLLFLSTINRTLKAYAGVIVAAEYILNIIPRQTHDYEKFIKPSELCAMTRKEGLETESITGLHYQPLTRAASLQSSVDMNYLLVCRKRST
jgi:2-polyprenyl-6-hydroxyphenyl methylase/3-demethylubiquinone-9 3-methyltransferase